ncbi:DUF4399 domain-containing protein [Gallaecimonas kandeliae]|uniref:DUF4399 domain-containing protein n=1 Tax=Gallaecimonas kandeliae TaxID=3029055 RepID=UPI00264A45B2|nr:DUF4399 domain-containing protein [Gallaecimonas kandeliae]WKE65148.1 DUF4399 domain-containing protein [Gallaecimonas kandeliae]
MKAFLAATALLAASASAFATEAPAGASVYFISPQDGATVSKTFTVRFGLTGMGVAPAGTMVKNTGHHHLLIDLDKLPDLTKPLPANDHVKHFGGGQTETQLTLSPGKHTLQLILGDYAHVPFTPAVISEKITVNVQ